MNKAVFTKQTSSVPVSFLILAVKLIAEIWEHGEHCQKEVRWGKKNTSHKIIRQVSEHWISQTYLEKRNYDIITQNNH